MDSPGKNRVLIVDDEKVNLLYLNHILSSEYTIYTARNGKEAVSRVNDLLPDLVLLDILMPEMDGYQTLAELKASEKTRDIPVIFVSGLSSSADEKKGLSLGAADYISKPFSDTIVKLRVGNQLKIVNQMRALNKRVGQQTIMTTVSRNFLLDSRSSALFTDTLHTIGGFMDLAQILLFKLEGSTLVCQNEWIHPGEAPATRIGSRLVLEPPVLSVLNNLMNNRKELVFLSTDPVFNMVMAPYRRNFYNYLIAPVFSKGKICALLDFSKKDEDEEWSASEQSLAAFAAGVFSGVFERDAIETNLSSVLKLEAEFAAARDRAEQSSRAKSGFLSRIGDEMRTPLNALMSMLHRAQSTTEAEKRRTCLAKAVGEARTLRRFVDDIADISALEKGKFVLVLEEFNFIFMLHRIFDETDVFRREKHQNFFVTLDPALPEILVADEKRLSQVVANLLSNAGKFTQDYGSIQFKASVLETEADIVTIQVEVRDNGPGIAKEHLVNLFVPFEHIGGGGKMYPGSGLGLSIAKNIVEMMSGSIWAESEAEKGSVFAFSFKARIKTAIPKAAPEKSASAPSEPGTIDNDLTLDILKNTRLEITGEAGGNDPLELFLPDSKQ